MVHVPQLSCSAPDLGSPNLVIDLSSDNAWCDGAELEGEDVAPCLRFSGGFGLTSPRCLHGHVLEFWRLI